MEADLKVFTVRRQIENQTEIQSHSSIHSSATGCFSPRTHAASRIFRWFWLAGGPVIMLFSGIGYALRLNRVLAVGLYCFTAAAVPAVRFADIRFYHGRTTAGEFATIGHGAKFAVLFGAGAVVFFQIMLLIKLSRLLP
jgi:hypothetical protein